jgi:hypothetical protein
VARSLCTRSLVPPSRLGVLTAALLLTACDGGAGDPASEPVADVRGDGQRISQVVGEPEWLQPDNKTSEGCSKPPDRNVYVTGIRIIAIDNYDETGEGADGNYYVQDLASGEPKPYSGMTVFAPSFSPPDLRLATGDVVDVLGVFMEFAGPTSSKFPYCRTLPEIGGTMSFRFDGGEPQAPKTIPLVDLKSYETARPYLGMLVRVEDVTLAGNGSDSGGRYTAPINVGGGIELSDRPSISNELYDIATEGPELKKDTTFKSVTGVVTYFYGFKLVPRSPADFEM